RGLAKVLRGRLPVAQRHQGVVRERMVDQVKRHAHHYTRVQSTGMTRARMLCLTGLLCAAGACAASSRAQAVRRVSLIVTGRFVVTESPTHQIRSPGAVAIDGTTIVAVDSPEAIASRFTAADTVAAADQIVLPGLINTHTHAPMVMYRGLADDL